MASGKPPEVVRERTDRLGGGSVSCAVVFDREWTRDEVAAFYLVESVGRPAPMDFELGGRVIAWECRAEEEARWRLALEIFLVKSFRSGRDRRRPSGPTIFRVDER